MRDSRGSGQSAGEETIFAGRGLGESRPGLDRVVVWRFEEGGGPGNGIEVVKER